ncbi:glycosyltransferase family 2 protein [Aureimonas psammosilenae]|uniref:glycosyltransferase family 2 protein n=1 Tax=Aureimonas psammosilenae TaxID=2495496 RepID=UPI0012604264|nr:glycosyltransferase family 2 protein [Aureimonas psammosilenae]
MREATVTVAIASAGRPSLAATLQSIAAQHLPDGVKLDVVIADDSLDKAVAPIVEARADAALRVAVVPVGARNIAIARNAALTQASGEFVAFIDDDEIADPDWIAGLLDAAMRHEADAVFGPVRAIYPVDAPSWIAKVGVFRKTPGTDGQRVETGATSNALFRRGAAPDLLFREEFGRTGGEDTDFFRRLHRRGKVLVASEKGAVSENVPPERLRVGHLRRRYTRGGHTFAAIMLEGRPAGGRAAFYASSAAKLAVSGTAALALAPFRRDLALSSALKAWLNLGKLLHAAGRSPPQLY